MFEEDARNTLIKHGLKVTPQRLAVLETLRSMNTHPSTDTITGVIREKYPHIATGTVYKILETFVEKGMIKRVTSDRDIMRFDARTEPHHHLYTAQSGQITDYFDDELTRMLEDYFRKKQIPGFHLEEIRLQLVGNFTDTGTDDEQGHDSRHHK
ncbi:MAG TPA: transcriptional repressor [Bacteroidetes bacterium]|nr:transcriptional repressor [Bacteroidota bacterium]